MRFIPVCLYILFFVITSCAKRVSPSGGEKDVTPPVLLNAIPVNKSTNFTTRKIELKFDEYIYLKDANQQIIVSPLMDPAPSFYTKKKSVIIELPDTLKQNTTYSINFGNAIVDVHEGNALPFQYVFSTGAVLDSLSVSGKALDALSQTGKKDVKLLMYTNDDDSLPFKKRPDYFAITDETGNFKISNIGAGTYYVVASDDKNSNYINDSPKEEAISNFTKIIVPDTNSIILNYFTESPKDAFIKNINLATTGRWDIALNKTIAKPNAVTFGNKTPFLQEWNSNNDTLIIWCNDTLTDTLSLQIVQDGIAIDTANIRLKAKSAIAGRGGVSTVRFLESFNTASGLFSSFDAQFVLMNPIVATDTTKIILNEDSTVKKFQYSYTDSLKRKFRMKYDWKEEKKYNITFLPGAFTDFTGRKNDSLAFEFAGRRINETGTIEFNITGINKESWILQLLTGDLTIVKELKIDGPGKYLFNYLMPQQLKARIIRDENNNGRWDTGSYSNKKEAEKVYYYNGELQSRANWDMEVEFEIINYKL
jgi:Bacterial Ig-like domain